MDDTQHDHESALRAELTHRPYRLTTEHSNSSYGIPVMVLDDGEGYARADSLPNRAGDALDWLVESAGDYARGEAHRIMLYVRAMLIDRPGLCNVLPHPVLMLATRDPRKIEDDLARWTQHVAHLLAFAAGRAATLDDALNLWDRACAYAEGFRAGAVSVA